MAFSRRRAFPGGALRPRRLEGARLCTASGRSARALSFEGWKGRLRAIVSPPLRRPGSLAGAERRDLGLAARKTLASKKKGLDLDELLWLV